MVCYVTNGSFIDNNAMDGLRKCLADEFTSVYCFNLRGNARTSGEQRRMEKGNVFGEGTRTNIAITLLIRNPDKIGRHQIFYHDIGDYLSRDEKLDKIKSFGNFTSIRWDSLTPNKNYDWTNQRDPAFDKFISLGDKTDKLSKTLFDSYSRGFETRRDPWSYSFSRQSLISNMTKMIDFYNSQVEEFNTCLNGNATLGNEEKQKKIEAFVNTDPKNISWSRGLKNDLSKLVKGGAEK
jgi:predicted helicase